MTFFGKTVRLLIPVAGAATGYAFTHDSWGCREALSKSLSLAEKKSFDEHFPRGTWDDNWDFRSPMYLINHKKYEAASDDEKQKMIKSKTATATRNIILIRHGQYQLDTKDKFLTELGREQALTLGKRLANSGMKFDHLIMSTMNRATETAQLILKSMPELSNSSCSLIEEGPPYPPVPETPHWRPTHSLSRKSGNSVLSDFLEEFFSEGARIESAFRRHIHRASPQQTEDSYELIVCHANVIRYFVCRALQFPPEGWLRISLGNCSMTWLSIRPNGRVSLKMMGDVGHLPAEKISYT